jgi:hypothetical protein
VAANISTALSFVKTAIANESNIVKMATIPSRIHILCIEYSTKIEISGIDDANSVAVISAIL